MGCVAAGAAFGLWACSSSLSSPSSASCTAPAAEPLRRPPPAPSHAGIHKIRHVIVVMQENRSFDSYFGTYPGADGIPMRGGRPAVSVPNPETGTCMAPFHDTRMVNVGGLHSSFTASRDIE